ncbi:MAG: hypothetical protein ACYCVB_13650 [Bacilli bacterium]
MIEDVRSEVTRLLLSNRYTHADIARRVGVTETVVDRIIGDLRQKGILPATRDRHHGRRNGEKEDVSVDSPEFLDHIQIVHRAIRSYAEVLEQSEEATLHFLSTRETAELAAELIGLSSADGGNVPLSMIQALAYVLEKQGYFVPKLTGFVVMRS